MHVKAFLMWYSTFGFIIVLMANTCLCVLQRLCSNLGVVRVVILDRCSNEMIFDIFVMAVRDDWWVGEDGPWSMDAHSECASYVYTTYLIQHIV